MNLYFSEMGLFMWAGKRMKASYYLAAEDTVYQEDVDALQGVDDGEGVGNDWSGWFIYRVNQKEAKTPRAAQDEELS